MKRINLIHRSIAIILACTVAVLCSSQATAQDSQQGQGTTQGGKDQDPQPKLLAPCIAAVVIIGIGIGGIYVIWKLCQMLPPPTTPPPPPPPPVPPLPPVTTNAPPATNSAPSGSYQTAAASATVTLSPAVPRNLSSALVSAVLAYLPSYPLITPPMPPVLTNGVWVAWDDVYGPPLPMLMPIPDSLRQGVLAAYSQGTLTVADGANRLLGTVSPMDYPISPPGSTNGSPGSTNELVLSTPYYWLPYSWATANVAITNSWDDYAATLYDISSLEYVDTNGPSATPVLYFATGTVSNLQSSTDLLSWSNYTFNAWISTNGMVTVLYDGSGIPVITNYGSGDVSGATNTVPFGIWVSNEPKKFFRIVPTQ